MDSRPLQTCLQPPASLAGVSPQVAEAREAIRLFDVEEWAEARSFFERALAQHDGDASRCHNGIGLCTACLAEGEQDLELALESFCLAVEVRF